jgi:hypothetical protein
MVNLEMKLAQNKKAAMSSPDKLINWSTSYLISISFS